MESQNYDADIYKKADSYDCGNYRGITLLTTTLQLYKEVAQSGFRPRQIKLIWTSSKNT